MTAITAARGRKALAVAAAFSLGALGVLASGAAANAATIDSNQSGQIIVHKYTNPGNGSMNPDGTGTQPTTDPIAGVVFEYCSIDGITSLTDGTNTGWNQLNAITDAQKQAAAAQGVLTLGSYTLSNCTSMPATGANGQAASASLPVGPYFVREISAPANVISKAAPFIVTIPTPKDNTNLDGGWVYDVNVYPKNTTAQGPDKNIVNQPTNGAALGAPIQYEVTQLIPSLAPGQTYDKFIVSDTLDTKLTPLTAVPVTVKAGSTTFVPTTDYTAVWSGQKLTVTLTAAGRAKLVGGVNIVVGFQAKANAVGEIDNQAYVNLNDLTLTPGQPNGPDGSPTTIVQTRWGNLTVEKVNAADTSEGLNGAKFNVYMGTTDQAGDCTADISGLAQVKDPTSGDPYVATSGADGTVAIAGLWVGDTEKSVAADGTVSDTTVAGHDLQQRCYVLSEIAAPAGFVLPTGAAALTPVMVKAGDNGTVALVKISNTQQSVPTLPLTGANGQLILTIGGGALILLAIGGVLIAVRRKTAHQDGV